MPNSLSSLAKGERTSKKAPRDLRGWHKFLGHFFGNSKEQGLQLDKKKLDDIIEGDSNGVESEHANERFLISNILSLDKKMVEDVMIPRVDMASIDSKTSLKQVTGYVSDHPYSRYPVYNERLDNIIGVLHVRNLLHWLTNHDGTGEQNFSLRSLLVRPLFVAPTMRVLDLLLHMREARIHMAMVVDEYGGIDGLVTMEDLVENIIGDIYDEHDKEKPPEIIECEDGSLMVDARLRLEVFERRYGSFFKKEQSDDIDTLGGFVFSIAGRIPQRGEVILHSESGLEFGLVDADPRRIHRLRIIFPKD